MQRGRGLRFKLRDEMRPQLRAGIVVNWVCPVVWSHSAPDVAAEVFLDKINIYISRLGVKQMTFHSVGGPHPSS